MRKNFGAENYKDYLPLPICEEHPEFFELYTKAWELAYDHIKDIPGMPQTPYMDEAFCATHVWIWDSCFMSIFCKYARAMFPGVETLNNFYEVIFNNKRLPEIVPVEEEPEWIGAKVGEPYEMKVHILDNPPLFAWAEYENLMFGGNLEYLKELLYKHKYLQKFYDLLENMHESVHPDTVFAKTFLIAEENGYRWEGGRSGMDNTPRGRVGEHAEKERPNNPDMLWLDAICQQAMSARIISKLFDMVGDSENSELWNNKYEDKKNIVNKLYWDSEDKFYYDIDVNDNSFYKVMTVASYWAMTAEVAEKEKAEALLEQIKNPDTFGGVVPFVSLSRSDSDYCKTGKYWRGSVWLPTAYAALKGFANYGYYKEAHDSALKLLTHMQKTYAEYEPHSIWECYNPEEYKPGTETSGEGRVRKDFCGWSALGPIAIYIEYVLGFHTVNAFDRIVKWAKPNEFKGEIGIKNLRFGDVVTDIVAESDVCRVTSNKEYTLEINGVSHNILKGENTIKL